MGVTKGVASGIGSDGTGGDGEGEATVGGTWIDVNGRLSVHQ